jgi:hypothetical protein
MHLTEILLFSITQFFLQNKQATLMQFKDPSFVRMTGSGVYILQLVWYFERRKSLHKKCAFQPKPID